jgi:hypothetical protein
MSAAPREWTRNEAQQQFVEHCLGMVKYWADKVGTQPVGYKKPMTAEDAVDGIAFSILVALDGGAMALPSFVVIPSPHESDKAYCQAHGENWYPEVTYPKQACDISGGLHELFSKLRSAPVST